MKKISSVAGICCRKLGGSKLRVFAHACTVSALSIAYRFLCSPRLVEDRFLHFSLDYIFKYFVIKRRIYKVD